jgi:hypothetical protein
MLLKIVNIFKIYYPPTKKSPEDALPAASGA